MSIRRLNCFVATAETQSFSRASERLNIACPALIRQVRLLEQDLRVDLFRRVGRTIVLTEVGVYYFERARNIINEIEDAKNAVRLLASSTEDHIRFGLHEYFSWHENLVEFLNGFSQTNSQCKLLYRPMHSSAQLEALLSATLDAGFLHNCPESKEIGRINVGTYEWCVILPNDHPLAAFETVSVEQIAQFDIVQAPSPPMSIADKFMRGCREQGLGLRIVQETDTLPRVFGLVSAGVGITVASGPFSLPASLCRRTVSDPPIGITVDFGWRLNSSNRNLKKLVKSVTALKEEDAKALTADQ